MSARGGVGKGGQNRGRGGEKSSIDAEQSLLALLPRLLGSIECLLSTSHYTTSFRASLDEQQTNAKKKIRVERRSRDVTELLDMKAE